MSLLLPILRSQAQGELLALLYLHPEREYSSSELAGLLNVSSATVSLDADRLSAAGLVKERRYGNMRLGRFLRISDESGATGRPLAGCSG